MLRAAERVDIVLFFIRVIREAYNLFPCTLHPFLYESAETAAIGMRDQVFPHRTYASFQIRVELLFTEMKPTMEAEIPVDLAETSVLQQLVSLSSHHLRGSNLATVSSARSDLPSVVPLFFQPWLLAAVPGTWERGSPAWEAAWHPGMQPTWAKAGGRQQLVVDCPFGCNKQLVLQTLKPLKGAKLNFAKLNSHFVRKHSRQFIAQLLSLDTHRSMKTVAPHLTDVTLAEVFKG